MAERERTGIVGLIRNIQDDKAASKMKAAGTSVTGGTPAQGIGGKLVTSSGTEIPDIPVGGTTGMTSKPQGTMSKIGHAIGAGAKSLLGFKTGGQITRSGIAFVHKGEHIIPANQTVERKALRKSTRKSGRR